MNLNLKPANPTYTVGALRGPLKEDILVSGKKIRKGTSVQALRIPASNKLIIQSKGQFIEINRDQLQVFVTGYVRIVPSDPVFKLVFPCGGDNANSN